MIKNSLKKAILFKKLPEQTVQCLACKHYCKIGKGEVGICGVRQNIDGTLYLLVYGKAVAVNIDPIEKKPLFHFLPESKIFSLGTIGCNFACKFCQNWDISQASKGLKIKLAKEDRQDDLDMEIGKMGYELSPEEIVAYCIKNQIPSIAYTYNEPAIFFEYTYDTAKLAKKAGIKNVYVSNGYASTEAVDKMSGKLDAINIDLKSFSEKFYLEICKAKLQPVLDGLKYYFQKGIWIEITTLLITGKNDSAHELKQIADFIAGVSVDIPWHISKFHPEYQMRDVKTTTDATIEKAYKIGKKAGLKYVYAGNIYNSKLQSTYCPHCNNLLIERDWGYTDVKNGAKGKCVKCGFLIPGIWKTS